MQDKNNETRFGTLLRKLERKLNPFGKHLKVVEKEKISGMITDAENEEIFEMIRTMQFQINNEIGFRVKQPIDSITHFERSNLIVSLSDKEYKHSDEIFEPFLSKGYTVVNLKDYEPFGEYHVYLVSWK